MILQGILVLGLVLAAGFTVRRWQQEALSGFGLLGWMAVWLAGIVLVLLPDTASRLALVVGVGRGVDLVVYVAIGVLFWLVFRLYVTAQHVERTLTALVSTLALREMIDNDTACALDEEK